MSRETRARGLILAVLLTGMVMNNIDVAIVNVAGPSIRSGLGASGAELQLIVAGYVLAFAVLLVTGARLGDLRGYRRMFLIGLAAFTLASLACGLAPGPVTLMAARVAQGVGAALMVPQVLTGIQLAFPVGPARIRALGWYAAALSGGAVLGQVLGGVLVWADLFGTGWRPVFLINVPIGVALLIAAYRLLPADGGRARTRLDLPGVALLSVTVVLVVLPLVLGRQQGWPVWAWVCLASSLPALALFVVVQRRISGRGGYPLVNLAILTRPVRWGLLSYAAATGTYFSMLFILALYLQQGLGHSALSSGLALVSWVAAFGIAGPALRRVPPRLAPYLAPVGYALLACSYLSLALLGRPDGVALIVTLGFGGLGLGCGFSAQLANLSAAVPTRFAADLSGVMTTTGQVTAVAAVAGFGSLYLASSGHGASAAGHAFTTTNIALAATAGLATVAGWRSVRALDRLSAGRGDQTRLVRDDHELSAVAGGELGE